MASPTNPFAAIAPYGSVDMPGGVLGTAALSGLAQGLSQGAAQGMQIAMENRRLENEAAYRNAMLDAYYKPRGELASAHTEALENSPGVGEATPVAGGGQVIGLGGGRTQFIKPTSAVSAPQQVPGLVAGTMGTVDPNTGKWTVLQRPAKDAGSGTMQERLKVANEFFNKLNSDYMPKMSNWGSGIEGAAGGQSQIIMGKLNPSSDTGQFLNFINTTGPSIASSMSNRINEAEIQRQIGSLQNIVKMTPEARGSYVKNVQDVIQKVMTADAKGQAYGTPAASGGGTNPLQSAAVKSAEARFNQLTGSGMSDQAAYAQMAQEGL